MTRLGGVRREISGAGEAPVAARNPALIVQTCGLSISRAGLEILHRVNLDVREACVTALTGPSGSGKTSLLLAINRMDELETDLSVEGQVLWRGRDVRGQGCKSRILRRKAAYIAPEPTPFDMSVEDNLLWAVRAGRREKRGEFFRNSREELPPKALVEESLDQVGLWVEIRDKLSRNALELSPGQQQRLCIARALAAGAELLLLDEPGRDLDPISAGKLEDALISLSERMAILMASANSRQAARVSQEIAVLIDGKLVETGLTRTVYSNPADPRTELFIAGRGRGDYP